MRIGALLAALVFASCASRTNQSQRLLSAPKGLPKKVQIEDVPFVAQPKDFCGPSTLVMAIRHAGKKAELNEVAAKSFSPAANGTFQADMAGALRRKGLMALPVKNMNDLALELAGGNPVIVFKNLGFEWHPLWHYALVTGYDLEKKTITLRSGKDKNLVQKMEHFERGWNRGGYWGLVALPAGQLSQSSGRKEHVFAAAALEKLGHYRVAKQAYLNIAQKWPESSIAIVGLGNIAYAQKDFEEAKRRYSEALDINPNLSFVWHNLAILLSEMGEASKARESAQRALAGAEDGRKELYKKSLKNLLRP